MHDMNEKSDIRRRKRAGHLGSLVIGPRSPMPSGHSTLPISAQQVEGGEIEGSNKINHARKGSAVRILLGLSGTKAFIYTYIICED